MGTSSRTVLLVDDEPEELAQLIAGLKDAGYGVHVATDGHEALRRIDRHRPDLLLSDLVMPGMNGHELLEQVRLNPLNKHVPVILFHTDWTGDLPRALNAWSKPTPSGYTADSHWMKPIPAEEWVSYVRRIFASIDEDKATAR
jgi:CheY-like chemotaxis protein